MKSSRLSGESWRRSWRTLFFILTAILPFVVLAGIFENGLFRHAPFVPVVRVPVVWISSVKNYLVERASDYFWLVDVKRENRRLKTEADVLKAQNHLLAGKIDFLGQVMRSSVHLGLSSDILSGARILNHDVTGDIKKVSIDSGRLSGVHEDQTVISAEGLVGRVVRVFHDTSEVLLLCDPRFSVDAVSLRTGARMMVSGLTENRLKGNRYPFLSHAEFVEKGSEILSGDELVTSGVGGFYPAGLPVGKVIKIDAGHDRDVERLLIQPAVDFAKIRQLFVVHELDEKPKMSLVDP